MDHCTTSKMLGADRASWPAGVAWARSMAIPNLLRTDHLRLFLKIWPVFAFRAFTVWDRRTTKIELYVEAETYPRAAGETLSWPWWRKLLG
jgi:hypothetical protein